MPLVLKALRKLGLSDAAYAVLSPFCGGKKNDMTAQAALRYLNAFSADEGRSSIRETPLVTESRDTDLDVIIPCYNVEKYLKACIESVLAQQTKYRVHIIAVNDGSTDATPQLLDAYAKDERLTVIHQKNRGLSGARNTGLEHSTARFVYFLDSDDVMLPKAVETLMDCAYDTGAGMVEGGYRIMSADGEMKAAVAHGSGRMPDGKNPNFAWGIVYRRELFDNICFPEGYWYEDSVLSHVLLPMTRKSGLEFYGVGESVNAYRINPAGIVRSGRTSKKSLDALWVHLRMYEDRKKLGIEDDIHYYDYMLRMVCLTYHRTENLPAEVRRAVFAVWADFFDKNFNAFSTENARYKKLERSLREQDYGRYCLFCGLN